MSRVINVVCCNICKHYAFGENKSYTNDRDFFNVYSEELVGEITKGYTKGDCICDNDNHYMMTSELSIDVNISDIIFALLRGFGVIAFGFIVVVSMFMLICGHCFK